MEHSTLLDGLTDHAIDNLVAAVPTRRPAR
jgi:hypothetical protein